VDGVLYPRAGTLGGCTAHNAMILVYPHNADWDGIARLTGDMSWNAENMRQYFMRLENCRYRPLERVLAAAGPNPSRHGWHGWLQVETAIPKAAVRDFGLLIQPNQARVAGQVGGEDRGEAADCSHLSVGGRLA
jgi:choline dehydrogenase-like flavoprotein